MRTVVTLLALVCLSTAILPKLADLLHAPQSEQPTFPYEEKWFDQTLDHFNFQTPATTFKQRVLYNDQYWKEGGPIFFYTGNEGSIVDFWNNTGFVFWIAPQFNALIIFAEHRYYGESMPFGNSSFDQSNVGFLTTEQALADYAVLLTAIKDTVPGTADSPVVAFGGSYGGMLSAWFRMKYPNIVIGSLAASAPILQFTGLTSPYVFNALATEDYTNVDPQCSANIRLGFQLINEIAQEDGGYEMLSDWFSLCEPIVNASDVSTLEGWATTAFLYMAMTDYPYPADFLQPLGAWPVNTSCKAAMANASDSTEDVLRAFAQAAGVYYNGTGSEKCFNFAQGMSGNLDVGLGWDYQACTEMVMPMATNGVTDMFPPSGWNLTSYVEYCQMAWGARADAYWMPIHFGGRNVTAASNIIFSNGMLDPWRGGSVTESLSDTLIAINIAQGAHHLDLRYPNPLDPPSVIAARAEEIKIIGSWLDAYYSQA